MSLGGFLGNYAKNHTAAGRMVGKYQRYHQQPGTPPPPSYAAGHPTQSPVSDPNPNPNPYDMGAPGQSQSDLDGGLQERMMAGDDTALGPEAMARGKLVTKPTIAKLGESGAEMVIPLNGKPGNHTSPDLLEGHLQPPAVQGMRYQRYRQFANKAY